MFLNILKIFVTLISFSITTSSAEEQGRFALIPSLSLNKITVSGFLIEERNSSSSSTAIFIFYQMYKPNSFDNSFKVSPSLIDVHGTKNKYK